MKGLARGLAWWWMLLALLGLTGCGTVAERGRADQFDKIAKSYEKAIRWSDFESAAGVAGLPASQAEAARKLSRVQVISYSAQSAEISPDTLQVRQTVQIEFMVEGSMKVRRLVDRQGWSFDAAQGRWVLVTGLPEFLGRE